MDTRDKDEIQEEEDGEYGTEDDVRSDISQISPYQVLMKIRLLGWSMTCSATLPMIKL